MASPKLRASLIWKLPGGDPGKHDILCSFSPCPACGEVVSEMVHFGDREPTEEELGKVLGWANGILVKRFGEHVQAKHGGK